MRAPPDPQKRNAPGCNPRRFLNSVKVTDMTDIASRPASRQASRRPAAHALLRGPRTRAVRALLETADLAHEARALAVPLLLRARKRKNPADALALEALLTTIGDQLAEVDAAGLALGQIGELWSRDDGKSSP